MQLDQQAILAMDESFRALFINSLSGFKSANLVGTCDSEGNTNLAIVSSVVHIGANPPLLAMIMRPQTVPRGTLENILATGVYTLNQVNQSIYRKAHQTSARYPAEVCEFEAVQLQQAWQDDFPAPFVAESRVRLGMELREHHSLKINGTEMLIGEIVHIEVPDECVAADGFVALEQAGTVAVSSLDSYHSTALLAHLSYAQPDQVVTDLSRHEAHSILSRSERHRPQRVLVVGASGGIGQAFCEQLVAEFPAIELIRTHRQGADPGELPVPVTDLELDLSADQSIVDALQVLQNYAPPDWVFIASGWLHDAVFRPEKSMRELQRSHISQAFDINATGPALLISGLLQQIPRRHPLRVGVLSARVGSISDNRLGGWYSYRASKAALNMLLKNFAIECKNTRRPVLIAGLQPGTTDTALSKPFQRGVPEGELQTPEYTARQLLQVMQCLQAEDSGKLFDFLGLAFAP